MVGMSLIGAGAMLDGFGELAETFSGSSNGYRVATNVEYAPFQEFGTASQSGTPHFRPGADATEAKMAQLATQADDLDEWVRLVAFQWEREVKTRSPVDTGTLRNSWAAESL